MFTNDKEPEAYLLRYCQNNVLTKSLVTRNCTMSIIYLDRH